MSRHVFGPKLDMLIVLAFIVVCLAIKAAWHQAVNGDWSCAFVKCMKVKT